MWENSLNYMCKKISKLTWKTCKVETYFNNTHALLLSNVRYCFLCSCDVGLTYISKLTCPMVLQYPIYSKSL